MVEGGRIAYGTRSRRDDDELREEGVLTEKRRKPTYKLGVPEAAAEPRVAALDWGEVTNNFLCTPGRKLTEFDAVLASRHPDVQKPWQLAYGASAERSRDTTQFKPLTRTVIRKSPERKCALSHFVAPLVS